MQPSELGLAGRQFDADTDRFTSFAPSPRTFVTLCFTEWHPGAASLLRASCGIRVPTQSLPVS